MSIYYNPTDNFLLEMRDWFRNNPISVHELMEKQENFILGPKHTDEVKNQISKSNLEYYQTELGIERRKKLSESNRISKSSEMKKRWLEDYESMKLSTKKGGRKKGCLDIGPRLPKCNIRALTDGKRRFEDAYEASSVYGIHPVNIRRKCRKLLDGWRYLND